MKSKIEFKNDYPDNPLYLRIDTMFNLKFHHKLVNVIESIPGVDKLDGVFSGKFENKYVFGLTIGRLFEIEEIKESITRKITEYFAQEYFAEE